MSKAFFELYDRLLGAVELTQVLRDVADVACRELHAERSSIYLIDRATAELESVAVIGNVARTIRVPIRHSSLAGHCALTGRSLVVPDAYGDLTPLHPELRFDRSWDQINDFRTRDVMCAPAAFKGEVIGVVQVINSLGKPFSMSDLPVLETLSRLIGYALYHARLYDDLATMKTLEKQKAQFMRVMVHELKAPIAGAKMIADALQCDETFANSPAAGMTAKISRRMAQLLDLIKELLVLAQVKSGDPLGQVSVIDLASAIVTCCEPYRDQAEQKGLALVVDLAQTPILVRFDSQGCQLVLSNLISNAIKYTPTGSVTVRLRAEPPWVLIEVSDTGMGIPEKDVPKLFNEFFRASNAKLANIEGSGVGLAGAKNLVERFGGEFTLRTRENQGSTFTVRLPLQCDSGDKSGDKRGDKRGHSTFPVA